MSNLEHIILDGTTLDITDSVARTTINRLEGEIPTKTSELTNDSGFITNANIPTKTSQLTNDSGFITNAKVPTKTSQLTNDSGFIRASYNSTNKTITFS